MKNANSKKASVRPLVFGSKAGDPVPVPPPPTPIEWSPHPKGAIGWSYVTRRIYAKPADGRPQQDFGTRPEAIKYLGGGS